LFPLEHTAQFVPAAADVDEKGDEEKLAGRLSFTSPFHPLLLA